jgi:aminopeptidase N
MYVRASRAREAEGDSLIAANARAARWLEEYFGVPFPFPKLDFVLAPGFPFGGMEHPGAIFYNEDQFIFREPPTPRQRLEREETIYHEIAHQWFGDLVTMRWFDDLWLKEGFATYTAAVMQAAIDTSSAAASGTWKRFFLQHKPGAYEVDGSKGTVAVWQPLDNLDQAKSNYGPIVYDKAPGILKQLHYLVGDSAFRRGVHQFLVQHAYADARWPDLLDAIGAAAGRSLDDWGKQYIRRPGMPVLEQRVTVQDGKVVAVALRQRPARELSGRGIWPLRVQLIVIDSTGWRVELPVEMRRADTTIALPETVLAPAFVFANAGDQGYVSLSLDPRSAEWLLAHVGGIRDPLLRAMGWESLWDRVREAQLAPARYLAAVTRELPNERDEEIAASLLGHAGRAAAAYISCAEQNTLLPPLTAVLRRIVMDTARSYGIRKASMNALVATLRADDSAGAGWIEAQLDHRIPGLPLGPPGRWAIITKLVEVGAPAADQRLAEEIHRDSTTDGQRRAFVARAARPTAEAKRVFFRRYLKDATLNEDWATSSLRAFNAASARTVTLPYLRPALDTLPWIQQHRRIFFLGAWLGAFLDGQVSDTALRITEDFLRGSPTLPADLKRKVVQAMDELERTVAIRRQFGGGSAECRAPARQIPASRGGSPAR